MSQYRSSSPTRAGALERERTVVQRTLCISDMERSRMLRNHETSWLSIKHVIAVRVASESDRRLPVPCAYSFGSRSLVALHGDGRSAKLAAGDIQGKFESRCLATEAEQRAIATALSDVDALLDGLDRLIAKKRDLKQAAMQQLLTGQTRLPGFHGEWEVKQLGDVCRDS